MTDSTLDRKPEPFDEIRGDRACIGCGFNLYAQPVSKEEHYGLAICRCPECGTVAALQQYPTMTHWVNRFRSLIAGVWILLLMGALFGNTMAFMGLSLGASNMASDIMAGEIGYANHIWGQEQLAAQAAPATNTNNITNIPGLPARTTITTTNGVATINGVVLGGNQPLPANGSKGQYAWNVLDDQWREDHLDEAVESVGGVVANIDRRALVMLIPGTVVAWVAGVFWSVVLLGSARKRVLLVPMTACLIGLAIAVSVAIPGGSWVSGNVISQWLYTPIVAPVYLAYLFVCSTVGVWIGRKIARLIVVMTLPPRARVPLSLLWTRDGLPPPRPAHHRKSSVEVK